MKTYKVIILFLLSSFSLLSQTINVPRFGSDSTLDIVTWNVENFPKNGQITSDYLRIIIDSLDADIIAFQEIGDTTTFKEMLSDLSEYQYSFTSSWYAGLAYIYKTESIQVNTIYEIYTSSQYWSQFPRSPLLIDFNYMDQRFIIMNNHLKCCGDGVIDYGNSEDEETRRYYAVNLLRSYIDTNFPNKNVIVLGDFNDELTDEIVNNVFKSFINYPEDFLFADMEIAQSISSDWSYPSWPSHLDHILITNELFDDFQNVDSEIKTQKIDDYLVNGWSEYQQNVSDHRPVAIKLKVNNNSGFGVQTYNSGFYAFPNPATSVVTFTFDRINTSSRIEIYNCAGLLMDVVYAENWQTAVRWNCDNYQSGVYVAKLIRENQSFFCRKIIVQ